MKKNGLRLAVIGLALALTGCANLHEEEKPPPKKTEFTYDEEYYRKKYAELQDQVGYEGMFSKYGYDFPDIKTVTEDFIAYRDGTVSFGAPCDGLDLGEWTSPHRSQAPYFAIDERGGLFYSGRDELETSFIMGGGGIFYFPPEGGVERICIDENCSVFEDCPHNMTMEFVDEVYGDNGAYIAYWNGCLFFTGLKGEVNALAADGVAKTRYIMKYDIEKREYSKLAEFGDQLCNLFVIRDGILYTVAGSVLSKYLYAIDLEYNEACRYKIDAASVYGVIDGKLLLSKVNYAKVWQLAEYEAFLYDPETGQKRRLATNIDSFCGAAGPYALFLEARMDHHGYDLYRQNIYSDTPELIEEFVAKFEMDGDRVTYLTRDGTLYRTDVIAYHPKKLAENVVSFRAQNNAVVYAVQDSGEYAGVIEADQTGSWLGLGKVTLWWSNGARRQRLFSNMGVSRFSGWINIGESAVFLQLDRNGQKVWKRVELYDPGKD